MESSDVFLVGTIRGFSLEATPKRNGIHFLFFHFVLFFGEAKGTEIGCWYGGYQKLTIKSTH